MATRNSSARKNGALDPALPQKKRARRRLVGAAAICLLAAIVLPIVLDSEPRQARGDLEVRIPSRETPLHESGDGAVQGVIGGARAARADADDDPRDPETEGEPDPGAGPRAEPVPATAKAPPTQRAAEARAADGRTAAPRTTEPAPAAEARADAPARPRAEPRSTAKVDPRTDARDARPAGESRPAAKPEAPPRTAATAEAPPRTAATAEARPAPRAADARAGGFLLQAGAFANEKAALDQLARLNNAGLKGYTEKVDTGQGPRIRVRAGPFPSRESAEKARAALKGAGVESAVIAP